MPRGDTRTTRQVSFFPSDTVTLRLPSALIFPAMTDREATFPALAPGTRHTRSTTSVTGAINQRTMPGWSQFHRAPAKKREHVHGRVGAKPLRARQGLRISGWVARAASP